MGLNRAAFLDYLIKNTKIFVAENENDEAVDGKTIEGYIATKNDRICALYANSVSIAHSLMRKFLHTTKFSEITFCTKNECWDIERNPSTVSKRIHRRHTRAVPSTIKWDRVYAVNVGVHII
ncbi:unnamed protein product [Dracunculus medinensis]|uniref:Uncharacterized protein n=1 Tax=Dracunculus medinensis TaxID=318479 RepID=A0A3P7PQM2_DRAME|nr:unnamed protein product [Dracunculus medinensis]